MLTAELPATLSHERRIPREERHELLLAMVAASDRLEHIIERLLEISQLETGAIRIEHSPVDVARLARDSEEIVAYATYTPTRGVWVS